MNGVSVVLYLEYGRTRVVFLADAQGKCRYGFRSNVTDRIPISMIKVAHHGSENGYGYEHISQLSNISIFQRTVLTPFTRAGLPNTAVVKDIEKCCDRLWITPTGSRDPEETMNGIRVEGKAIGRGASWLMLEFDGENNLVDEKIL